MKRNVGHRNEYDVNEIMRFGDVQKYQVMAFLCFWRKNSSKKCFVALKFILNSTFINRKFDIKIFDINQTYTKIFQTKGNCLMNSQIKTSNFTKS